MGINIILAESSNGKDAVLSTPKSGFDYLFRYHMARSSSGKDISPSRIRRGFDYRTGYHFIYYAALVHSVERFVANEEVMGA